MRCERCRSCGDLQPIRSATPVLPGLDEDEASVDAVRAALASLGSYTTTSSRWYAAIWEGWVSGASAAPEREGTRRCGYAHTIIATPALRAITHVARSEPEAGDLCTACAASCCRLLGRGTKMVPAS
jgi:hypothetical protein